MKRRWIGSLCLCLLLFMCPVSVLAAYENPFTDVKESNWYYENVQYVNENGLMTGLTDTTFGPKEITNRAMVVTILYRQEGEPVVTTKNPFSDVKAGAYYENAVVWANANKIVNGYTASTYGPKDPITRQQMAAIIYRYADYKGYDVTASADLSKYQDLSELSSWAKTAMSWANAEGLINGLTDTKLGPLGNAERAQVAAILQRFCENIVPVENAVEVHSLEELHEAMFRGEKNLKAEELVVGDMQYLEIPESVRLEISDTLTVEAGGEVQNMSGNLKINNLVMETKDGDRPYPVFVNQGNAVIRNVTLEDGSWDEEFSWMEFSNGVVSEDEENPVDNTGVTMKITGTMDIGACTPMRNAHGAKLVIDKGAFVKIDGDNAGIDNWGDMEINGSLIIEEGAYHGMAIAEDGEVYPDSYGAWFGAWGDTTVNGNFIISKFGWAEATGNFTVGKNGTMTLMPGEVLDRGYYEVIDDQVVVTPGEYDHERGDECWVDMHSSSGFINTGIFTVDGALKVGSESWIDNGNWWEENDGVQFNLNGTAELNGTLNNAAYGAELNIAGTMKIDGGYFENNAVVNVTESGKMTLKRAQFCNCETGTVTIDGAVELLDGKYNGICEYADEWGNVYADYEYVSEFVNDGQTELNGTLTAGKCTHVNNLVHGSLIVNGTMDMALGERMESGYYEVEEDGKVVLEPGDWDDERGEEGWYDEWSHASLHNYSEIIVNGQVNGACINNNIIYMEEILGGRFVVAEGGTLNQYAWFNNNSDWVYNLEGDVKWTYSELIVEEGGSCFLKQSEHVTGSIENYGTVQIDGELTLDRFTAVINHMNEAWGYVDGEDQCINENSAEFIVNGTMNMTDAFIDRDDLEDENGNILHTVRGVEGSVLDNNGMFEVNGELNVSMSTIWSNGDFQIGDVGKLQMDGLAVDPDEDGNVDFYTQRELEFNGNTIIYGQVIMNNVNVGHWGEGLFFVNGDVEINGGKLYIGERADIVVGYNASLKNEGLIVILDMEKEDGTIETHIDYDFTGLGEVVRVALVRTYEGLMGANAKDSGFVECELWDDAEIIIEEDMNFRMPLVMNETTKVIVRDGCTLSIEGYLANYAGGSLELQGSAAVELYGNEPGPGGDHVYMGSWDGFDITEDVVLPAGSEYAYKTVIKRTQ